MRVAGHDEAAELGALDAAEEDELLHVLPAQQQVAGGVVHEFEHHDAGQDGKAREMPVEHRALLGQDADHANGQALDVHLLDAVDQFESIRDASADAAVHGRLLGDELVDPRATGS